MPFLNFLKKQYHGFVSIRRQKYLNNLVAKGLKLGCNVTIVDTFFFDPAHCFLISIGDNCTICPNVRLIAHDASTKRILGYTKIGKISIKENCFIGDSVIVLPNVSIGPNAIVGAGSVVTKDIPPGTVFVGNPARLHSSLSEYTEKIQAKSRGKKIFDRTYLIDAINEEKKKEVRLSCNDEMGFIV